MPDKTDEEIDNEIIAKIVQAIPWLPFSSNSAQTNSSCTS